MKTTKYIQDLSEKITKNNKSFAKMTPAQRRVAVAKDTLKAIQVGFINPIVGSYVLADYNFNKVQFGEDMQTILLELPYCNCCAKGALFVVKVAKFNHCKVDQNLKEDFSDSGIIGDDGLVSSLDGVFTRRQLNIIENAFEAKYLNGSFKNKVFYKASFLYEHLEPKDRLIAICENIIKNDGDFHVRLTGNALKRYNEKQHNEN